MKRLLLPIACILFLCALLLRSPAHAQQAQVLESGSEPLQQDMTLTVGDILEILPLHTVKDAKYAWILTQDRTFIEAQRTSVYRTRLTLPGSYTLFAEISGSETASTIRRTFHLTVTAKESVPDGANPVQVTGGSGETLVTTEPKAGPEARVILAQGEETLILMPLNPERTPLALDLDTQTDSNGDGNTANDVDDANTYFQTNAVPLTLWFASPLVSFNMAVTAVGTDGNAIVQPLHVFSYEAAKNAGITISPANIIIAQKSDSVFEFSVDFKDSVPGSTPLLYHWEFGDSEESLVAKPVHTYHGSGTYSVQLSIQNLLTGKEVAHYQTQVTVVSAAQSGSEASEASSSPAVTPAESGGGFGIGTILLLVLVLIVSIAAGVGIMFLLSKLLKKRKPLHETIAEMEASMAKSDQVPPPAAPLVIDSKKIETPASSSAAKKDTTPPVAAVDVNAAPSWLKKGLDTPATPSFAAAPSPVAPPPSPPPVPAAPKPATAMPSPVIPPPLPVPPAPKLPAPPAPTAPAVSASAPAKADAAMPAWLQNANGTPAAKPAPAPVAPPVIPAPVVKPAAAPPPPPPVVSTPAPVSPPVSPAATPVPPAPKPVPPPAPAPKPVSSAPAATPSPTAVKPAPVVPAVPAPTAPKAPAPVAAAPALPVTPPPVVTPPAPKPQPVPPPPAPKKEPAPASAKPAPPVTPAPAVSPAPVAQTPPASKPSAPAPAPEVMPPKAPAAPVVTAPKAPPTPAAPKPLPAPIPDKELPPAKPTANPSNPVNVGNEKRANEPTSNGAPDPTIAVIRAESIEEQNKNPASRKN